MACVVDPTLDIGSTEALRKFGTSPLATDARSLFDAARSITPGMKLSERRTAIEVAIVKDRMSALDGRWFWVNSQQQIADGLTKPAAKDNLAYVLNRGTHKLSFEPDFIAARRKKLKEKNMKRHRKTSSKTRSSRLKRKMATFAPFLVVRKHVMPPIQRTSSAPGATSTSMPIDKVKGMMLGERQPCRL